MYVGWDLLCYKKGGQAFPVIFKHCSVMYTFRKKICCCWLLKADRQKMPFY